MKNNKLLTIMLIILVSITLIGVVAVVVVTQLNKGTAAEVQNIDDIVESSVDIEEITTNIAGDNYIKIALKIQTTSKDSAEELKKRDFQVKSILIEQLSEMSKKDLDGTKGKEMLANTLKTKINELMQEGEVQQVYFTSYIIQ
ncbi:flagellar basal body-associated protein FliL [Rummeliibacillus sp. TYF005]|uniref:flagellar basal body-associated protein FliL n=1 Tax=Rummeliibacillus sp. TYF005 TaxID=2058214 RepID=UPI000F530B89|nr:flagellar basal body-associated protein FliL [Rummeliibacillus sp. TYF005]RPJ96986.1 flagellar basal body-associated protein FliL [Rummeliibacillus sp. TYF005]